MIKTGVHTDFSRLDRIERNVLPNAQSACHNAAEAMKRDIRDNWSPISPSSPGNPPAILTGNLDESIFIEKQGRDALGRFTSRDNTTFVTLTIDTTKGPNPMGRGNYEYVHEYGERPFVAPAADRLWGVFGTFFRDMLR